MNKKLFKRAFIITNVLLGSIFYLINSQLNRDDDEFSSSLPTINSEQLLADSNYVVSIVSYSCSSHPKFMPELKLNIDIIKEKGYNLYIVNDSEYSITAEKNIKKLSDKYEITEQIFLIDPVKYPENSGFFNAKKRYSNFVNDLSSETKNLRLGYGYYLIFKNGILVHDGYNLNAELL